ncbi:Protein CBG20975 [Caenorhabditis briggsae]|uniref:Protein CBG20975 n=1 Tax=Caenorhabditis briggsae TaxID=6238 RepID=A8XZ29_CAEBR|nr:Protein CBG20975 [Caenorhabditis briggsae]CAP37896.1 Protein CBG20975 [Caenorhabditis briggsae]
MSRKKLRLVIRNSANLTDQMRKERQAETFEEMSTAQSKESTTSTESIRQKRKTATTKRTIRIQKERIVKYEADLVSGYERSENTQSMDSISEPENIEEFEKKCGESKHIGPQLIPIKFVATDVETPVQAIFVSDFDLCEAMHHPKPNSTQSKKVEFSKRFEVEQKFLEELVTDIEKLLVTSGRMDVELKVVKTIEPNGTPHGKISLIRKMKAEKPGTNLSKTHGLHGFAPSEILMKDSEFHGNDKEKITKIHKIPEGFNVYKSFKRLFGY